MKRALAKGIVRFRLAILAGMLLIAALCVPGIARTRINYDLTAYLAEDTMTRRSMRVMEEEFGASEQLRVLFWDVDEKTLSARVQQLQALPEVFLASHDPETGRIARDGHEYRLVNLTLSECDGAALVETLRGLYPGECWVGGSAAEQLDVQESVGAEMPEVMVISVLVVLAVLLLTSHAWLEPAVLLIVLALSILINMGTNFIFPQISFITFAVCAILQLALSIDYAIMLLHAYNGFLDRGLSPEEAMTEALAGSFMPVSSSALTTVAGLLSLLFMSFTIGFDIGVTLSKGILISMLCVFLLMPSVTLLFGRALRATRHRPLSLGGAHLAGFVYRGRRVIALVLILLAAAGYVLQTGNRYLFHEPGEGEKWSETRAINGLFGASNPLVLMVPGGQEDEDYDRQRALAQALSALTVEGAPAVGEISAMVTTGAQALEYCSAEDVAGLTGMNAVAVRLFFLSSGLSDPVRADRLLDRAEGLEAVTGNEQIAALRQALSTARAAFEGPHYARMLLQFNFPTGDARANPAIDGILSAARSIYGEDVYLTGVAMSSYDIGGAFEGDLLKVNLITLLAILLIVALSFRAICLPALLVFVIEGAIAVTMGISRLLGQPIFFMSYLICVSIQMGATIDYGILLSERYRAARREGKDVPQALVEALTKGMPTVLTSGVILTTAGYIIGRRCSVYYISAIGLLLSRGAAVSVCLVLTLLPALLSLCDRWVIRGRQD